jgi:short-subunit dehydrogenase
MPGRLAIVAQVPRSLVTGPTSGIGHAFATRLAAEGHDLVLVSRDAPRLRLVADDLQRTHGVTCEVVRADLSDLEQTRGIEARLRAEAFSVVINNAGFGMAGAFETNDVEAEQASLDVLVRAVMRLTHAALDRMLDAGRGDIVNVSSVGGFLPRGTYAANKAWVTSFSGWAGVHYRHRGVRVMALCPGFVRTEFHQRMHADLAGIPSWMWLDPESVVRTALHDLRKGKAVSIPTRRYQVLTTLARATPRTALEKIARRGR